MERDYNGSHGDNFNIKIISNVRATLPKLHDLPLGTVFDKSNHADPIKKPAYFNDPLFKVAINYKS